MEQLNIYEPEEQNLTLLLQIPWLFWSCTNNISWSYYSALIYLPCSCSIFFSSAVLGMIQSPLKLLSVFLLISADCGSVSHLPLSFFFSSPSSADPEGVWPCVSLSVWVETCI